MLEAKALEMRFDEQVVFSQVSCAVAPGEIVAVIGSNGSGKSTLGAVLAGRILPTAGSILIDGMPLNAAYVSKKAQLPVAILLQNPADQIVSAEVYDEVAFGPRNLGCSEDEVKRRVTRALATVNLSHRAYDLTNRLSGGEQQRLALASCLAMSPRYLILDEPTAMLDVAARKTFRTLIRSVATHFQVGIFLITHDSLEALMAHRVIVMQKGSHHLEGVTKNLIKSSPELFQGLLVDNYVSIAHKLCQAGYDGSQGFEPEALVMWAQAHHLEVSLLEMLNVTSVMRTFGTVNRDCDISQARRDALLSQGFHTISPALEARHLTVVAQTAKAQQKQPKHQLITDVTCLFEPGTYTLIAGRSGAGKTTLAMTLAGVIKPAQGQVLLGSRSVHIGEVGITFQNPNHQFFCGCVFDEIAFGLRQNGADEAEIQQNVQELCILLGIPHELLKRDPFVLSGGEARRVALAAQLSVNPQVLILDEPTAGLDAQGRQDLFEALDRLQQRGMTVVVISHDIDEWIEHVHQVLLMSSGQLVWDGTPELLNTSPDALTKAGLTLPTIWEMQQMLSETGLTTTQVAHHQIGHKGSDVENDAPRETMTPNVMGIGHSRKATDARVGIVLFIVMMLGTFMMKPSAAMVIWVILTLSVVGRHMGFKNMLYTLKPAIILMILVGIANIISVDGTAEILMAGAVGLSISGAIRAVIAVTRLALVLLAAGLLATSVDAPAFADACVRFMRPLGKLGIPTEEIGQVLALALRFIPMISEEFKRIQCAQAVRGVDLESASRFTRIRAWLAVFVPALVGLMHTSDKLAASMDARGYVAGAIHVAPQRSLGRTGWIMLSVGIAAVILFVTASYFLR